VSFVIPIVKLGFDATLVKELIDKPHKEGEILGTSFTLNFISSILSIFSVFLFASFANAGETATIIVCVLYSLMLLFTVLEMTQFWFQYKLLSKYSSVVMLISYFCVSAYKIFLLITEKSVYWFAVSHSIEYGLIGLLLIIIYFRLDGQKLSFSKSTAKEMLSRSKYYIVASLLVVVFQNIGVVLLSNLSGYDETGYYTSALMSATVVQFVYTAITDSYRPLILTAKKESNEDYEKNVSGLYGIIVYTSLAQSIVFAVFAKLIISILYGADFMPAVPVLRILVWFAPFSFMGTVRNIWLLAEEKQKELWKINLFGVVINTVSNAILIPKVGACGAAIAAFITQFLMNFVLGFIYQPIRKNNELMIKGLNPKFAFNEFISIWNMFVAEKFPKLKIKNK
jgi:O-antigen/teichoic acid export membrane protein